MPTGEQISPNQPVGPVPGEQQVFMDKAGHLRTYQFDESLKRHQVHNPVAQEKLLPQLEHVFNTMAGAETLSHPVEPTDQQRRLNKLLTKQDKSHERQSDIDEALDAKSYRESLGMISWTAAKIEKWGRSKLSALRQKRIERLSNQLNPDQSAEKKKPVWNRLVDSLRRRNSKPLGKIEDFTEDGEVDAVGWLSVARDDLARLSAKSRFSLFGKKSQLEEARFGYNAAFSVFMTTEILDQQEEDGAEYTTEEFKEAATMIAVEEIAERTRLEAEYVGKTRRGRFLNWYSKLSTAKKIALGGAAGAAVGAMGLVAGAGVVAGVGTLVKFGRSNLSVQARSVARKQHDAEFRAGLEELYLAAKLADDNLEADDSASIQENAEHRANAVVATMARGNIELGKYDRKKARTAAAVGVLSVAGGYFAGKAINGALHGKGRVSRVGGPKGSPGPTPAVPSAPGLVGGGVEVIPAPALTAPSEIVSHITPGAGLIDNLTHTEVGLNPVQAARAVERMRAEGLLDGTHIAGVAERAGRIVVYARGAGDGALHFSDPRVLEIIQETKSS